MASRIEEIALKYNQAVADKLLTKTEELKIGAILAVGAEINMLRVAINTNSIDLEECVNNLSDNVDTVVNSLDSIADKLESIDVYWHQQNGD